MARWRAARDAGTPLTTAEQAELDALIGEEIPASAKWTGPLLHEFIR